jgi:rfaE bifunctional protein nucleotidyltransferase chain/domain
LTYLFRGSTLRNMTQLNGEWYSAAQMRERREELRKAGKIVVFTNGAFDILHTGHLAYLQFAREQGDCLIIGLNSDDSVRRNKGPERPVNDLEDRAKMLLGLRCVDYVVVYEEDEPERLISILLPDVLVKGADWAHYVSGRDIVESHGGRVVLADIVPGKSTSNLINRIRDEDPVP